MSEYHRYRVELINIRWDDGKGEYDVSDLPSNLRYIVEAAPSQQAAIEYAMSDADAEYGCLIAGARTRVERE